MNPVTNSNTSASSPIKNYEGGEVTEKGGATTFNSPTKDTRISSEMIGDIDPMDIVMSLIDCNKDSPKKPVASKTQEIIDPYNDASMEEEGNETITEAPKRTYIRKSEFFKMPEPRPYVKPAEPKPVVDIPVTENNYMMQSGDTGDTSTINPTENTATVTATGTMDTGGDPSAPMDTDNSNNSQRSKDFKSEASQPQKYISKSEATFKSLKSKKESAKSEIVIEAKILKISDTKSDILPYTASTDVAIPSAELAAMSHPSTST